MSIYLKVLCERADWPDFIWIVDIKRDKKNQFIRKYSLPINENQALNKLKYTLYDETIVSYFKYSNPTNITISI